jgi:hypothetical protein
MAAACHTGRGESRRILNKFSIWILIIIPVQDASLKSIMIDGVSGVVRERGAAQPQPKMIKMIRGADPGGGA